MKHKLHLDYSTQLLHRHFPMEPHEKLVEYGPTQSPWPAATVARVVGGHVVPKSWRVWGDELHPYEFRFVSLLEGPCPGHTEFSVEFMQELKDLLAQTGLLDLLGVTAINHDQPDPAIELMEVTYGRNSIMVPLISEEIWTGSYNAGWGFVETGEEDTSMSTRDTETSASDGVTTRHGTCYAADGVVLRHGTCYAAEGVETRHGTCYAAEGVKVRHGTGYAAEGVKVRHGTCYAAGGIPALAIRPHDASGRELVACC